MTTYALLPLAGAGWQLLNDAAQGLANGYIYVYDAGTTTPATTWADYQGNTANQNPIRCDPAGRPSYLGSPIEVWGDASKTYKFVITDSAGANARTFDHIPPIASSADLAAFEASLAATTGGGLVGLNQLTVYPENTLGAKLTRTLSAKDGPFNAKGDGSTDDLTALNSWASEAGPGTELILPASGDYNITAALDPIAADDILISGPGVIKYVGASTTPGNLMTIGDGLAQYTNVNLSGFRIDSANQLTGGAAIRVRACLGVYLSISLEGPDDNTLSKLYDGVITEACTRNYFNMGVTVKNDAFKMSDGIIFDFGKSFVKGDGTTGTALYFAGGCADINTQNLSELYKGYGCKVDNSVSANPNQQFIFNESSKFDSNGTADILLDDNTASTISKYIRLDCQLATSPNGLLIATNGWSGGRIFGSPFFINHQGTAIYSDDTTVSLTIDGEIIGATTYGLNAGALWSVNVRSKMGGNGTNFSTNILNGGQIVNYNPAGGWGLDLTGNGTNAVALTTGNTIVLPAGSGLVEVTNASTGLGALFYCEGGAITKIAGDASIVSGAPGASQVGFLFSGGSYRVTNGYATTQNIYVSSIRCRDAS